MMKRSREREPNPTMGPTILDLPNHILMEILTNLPTTTICNCRCVCTHFRNLISHPDFARLHHSSRSSSLSSTNLMLRSSYLSHINLYLLESVEPYFIDSGSKINDGIRIPKNAILKFKPEFDVPSCRFDVLSSCHGLICFYSPITYNPYVICNPVINEFVVVPQFEKQFFDQRGSGFGFCPGSNEYKVLRFLSPSLGFGLGLLDFEAEIITLGTNVWRKVGGDAPPSNLHWFSSGCFLDGALHWIVHNSDNCFQSMCCFDLGKERFQPFPWPSELGAAPSVNMMHMGLLGDCLSVFYHSRTYQLDIWMMKNYGVKESWTKEFVINLPWPVDRYGSSIYQPIMFLNSGEILMLFPLVDLLLYNTKDRRFRRITINGIGSVVRAVAYRPSFISIKNAATWG